MDQTVTLTVLEKNRAPIVSSNPPTLAVKDEPYTYAIKAADPDGHDLRFSLSPATTATGHGPISIDPATGLLTWTPDAPGTYRIQINVVDELGLGVAQIYDVQVLLTASNDRPRFESTPPLTAEAGSEYVYVVQATDPEGRPLTFTPLTTPANARQRHADALARPSANRSRPPLDRAGRAADQ